jgi:very-short-patch-repair endonuclease
MADERRKNDVAVRNVRLGRVTRLAAGQGGVVSRRQVYAAGITRSEVLSHVRARRWRVVHSQSLAVHTGPLRQEGLFWAALFEAGDRGCLDGVSSLLASGLEHYEEEMVRVSVPRGVLVRRAPGLVVRQTRRLRDDDRMTVGIPGTRPEVAAIRAALWARSDKQAALLLTMAVQQGLTTPEQLTAELLRIRRAPRHRLVATVVADLVGGVRSLGEHEFAQLCRARGLPEPSRQVLRRGKNGRYYLDVCWEEWGVVVEVDGIQHAWASHLVADALRHNAVALERALVLRLPLLGLRVAADEFFAQVEEALRSRGYALPTRVAS